MRIDLSCPIEVQNWEIMHDDRAHARAYLHLYNCADDPLSLLDGTVRWIEGAGGNYTETTFSLSALNVNGRSAFTVPVSTSYIPQNVRLLVYFTRAVFSGGTEWTGSSETLGLYPDVPVLPGAMANALAAQAGPDAVCCAWERENGLWQCVCGRWNEESASSCMRCRRDKAETLRRFHPEAVEQFSPAPAPADVQMPMTDSEPANAGAKNQRPPLARVLAAVAIAAVFAVAALTVRSYRYRETNGAGLMPTSRLVEPADI